MAMTIRYRPTGYRIERVTTPRPAPPAPETPPLPLTPRPPAPPPVRQRPRDWRREAQRAELARKQARAAMERATPEQVQQALTLAGISQRDLAAKLSISRSCVAETLRG